MKILKFSILSIALASVLMTSCDFKKQNYNTTTEEEVSLPAEDSYEAKRNGYNKGYDDGYSDGYGWLQHGVSYNDRNSYQTDDASRAYKNGYSNGYDEGYYEGESKQKAEREANKPFYIYHNDNGEVWISRSQEEEDEYQRMKAQKEQQRLAEEAAEEERKKNDFHNWDKESVSRFYAEFYAYDHDDAEEKHYFYKKVDDRYFYEINLGFDAYTVEIEYKLDSKFYKINGSNVFLEFYYDPYLSRWDEGVLDCSGSSGTYYKKP